MGSIITLFRCATGESFNGLMHDLMAPDWGSNMLRCCPTCGPQINWDEIVSFFGTDGLALYLLGRWPDPATSAALQDAANRGANGTLIAALVFASPEFQQQ